MHPNRSCLPRPPHPLRALLPVLAAALLVVTSRPAAAAEPPAAAPTWTVDAASSLFAVLTHKAGLGARLAHDHLVVARGATATLAFDPARPEATGFDFSVPVLALDIDPAAERAAEAPRLRALGALDGELAPVDDEDRTEVREAMLSPRQLFASRFSHVRAELAGLAPRTAAAPGPLAEFAWEATVRVSVRDRTVERRVPVRLDIDGSTLRAEALGEFRFTEFGIEPYSAFLGAVRNEDLFHIFVRLVARAESAVPPSPED